MNKGTCQTPCTEINRDQKLQCKTLNNKYLEENLGQKLQNTEFGNDFLHVT